MKFLYLNVHSKANYFSLDLKSKNPKRPKLCIIVQQQHNTSFANMMWL